MPLVSDSCQNYVLHSSLLHLPPPLRVSEDAGIEPRTVATIAKINSSTPLMRNKLQCIVTCEGGEVFGGDSESVEV
jgi:hypothetical protein